MGWLHSPSHAFRNMAFACILGCSYAAGAGAQQFGDEALSFAQETWDATLFFPGGTYEPAVPTPESVLGFPLGRRPVRLDELRRYLEALAASSPRVHLDVHGTTHEGRELFHVIIGREERLRPEALEALRQRLDGFADPRHAAADGPAADQPLVAWLGYSIHGDELSGSDAALQVAYQLAAGTDAATRSIRDSLLVFLDPTENPDGRERYLAQMQAFNGRVPNSDDQSLQHRGFWPWGRGNHYLFDLNRDWFTLVHPESRGRVSRLLQWHPQIVVDVHEMGWDDTYLFSPPREPFNPNQPQAVVPWEDRFARDQAAAFDRRGWSHYTREWNEEFFPGYGSSWGKYQGAVGILYEQAGTDGSVVRQTDGTYLSFREAVQHQFTSSLANLETAMRHRSALLADYRRARRAAVEAGRNGPVRAFAFVAGTSPDRAAHLARTLQQQGIEVLQSKDTVTLRDAHDAWGTAWKRKELPARSYVVMLDQPSSPLVRNLLDFHVAMPDSFLREERQYLESDKGSRLYEVTAWSLPLGYAVETYWTAETPRGELERATEDLPVPSAGSRPAYGYVIDGGRDASLQAIAFLLARDHSVRIALDAFEVAGRPFPRGSALLRVGANHESLHEDIREAARLSGCEVFPTDSGRATDGPDLGGSRFPALTPPRIALLAGYPVSFVSYGSLWHLLDHDLQLRVSSLDVQSLPNLDLEKYNLIVMPDAYGGAAAYARALGPAGTKNLETWVRAGGTLVGLGAGAAFAADSSRALSGVRLRRDVLARYAPSDAKRPLPESPRMDALGDAPRQAVSTALPLLGAGARRFVEQVRPRGVSFPLQYGPERAEESEAGEKPDRESLEQADARLRRFRPQGAYVRADLDSEDWLTAGSPLRLPVLVRHEAVFIAADPVFVAARFATADSLHVSGLLWAEAANRLARTAYATREACGKGQVILFAGDPSYRRAARGSERLLLNALLLGPGLGVSRPAPW